MELTCRHCASKFRAAVQVPLTAPVRVACPSCTNVMVLKPRAGALPAAVARAGGDSQAPTAPRGRLAAIADEPRPFREFLGQQLIRLGFEVVFFENGEPILEYIRRSKAALAIVNVYLKGKLGVEVSEEIKSDPSLQETRVILIGALFRANRFRANPTNLYGADEYIEEQIPEKEFRQIIRKLFPEVGETTHPELVEPREYDEARRLARLILSDIIIYHPGKVEHSIRDNNFFEVLHKEIEEGRQYYDSRVPMRVRRDSEIYTETLQQFVQMKREELDTRHTGT
ncbi:MAG TPA: response regulator [Thermoanaerobaculia bacterium]|nr:response regulator [Thermoanaerobaculia bacterium]